MGGEGVGQGVPLSGRGVWVPARASLGRNDGELRKPIRPALLDAPLEGRAGVHPSQPGREVRVWLQLAEHFGHLADKAHLDVGA